MNDVESISTNALRHRGRRLGWAARFTRSFDNIAGNEGFVIVNAFKNHIVDFVRDENELREWLSGKVKEREHANW